MHVCTVGVRACVQLRAALLHLPLYGGAALLCLRLSFFCELSILGYRS